MWSAHPFNDGLTATCNGRALKWRRKTLPSVSIQRLVHVTVSTVMNTENRIESRMRARQLMYTKMDISGGGDSITYSRNTNRFVQELRKICDIVEFSACLAIGSNTATIYHCDDFKRNFNIRESNKKIIIIWNTIVCSVWINLNDNYFHSHHRM